MSNIKAFRELHHQDDILHIGNVWDVHSALVFEQQGYKALGTSSAAIAGMLGYDDGEQISFDDLLYSVQSILKVASIPLTVDLEAGYSRDLDDIVKNIMRLASIGVVGINLEDSVVDEGKNRKITDAQECSRAVEFIKNSLTKKGCDIFVNIRTDSYIMGLDNPIDESEKRVILYENSGADGVFIPCVTAAKDIRRLVSCVAIPVNVMAMPNLPDFSMLKKLGVKRVSSGPFIYNKLKHTLCESLKSIQNSQSFNTLF